MGENRTVKGESHLRILLKSVLFLQLSGRIILNIGMIINVILVLELRSQNRHLYIGLEIRLKLLSIQIYKLS